MKIILAKPYLPVNQRTIVTFPIGLMYLGSYLNMGSTGEVSIKDPDIYTGSYDSYVKQILDEKPDVVGISIFSHVLQAARRLVKDLKSKKPDLTVIIGGSHVNATRQKALAQIPEADFAIWGEGEKSFREFCHAFRTNRLEDVAQSIPGLIYRTGDEYSVNDNYYTDNLDEFDPLDFSLIDIDRYMSYGSPMGLFHKRNNVAQIITTRGCPFSCTFCASPLNMGKKIRKRSTQSIMSEIQTLKAAGANEIHIMDDNFTFNSSHVIDLCNSIIDNGIEMDFCMPNGVRLDRLNEQMVTAMKKAGWYHLGFGVEVGSDESLKLIRKGITMDKIKEKVDLVRKAGIGTTGFFILGLPHDNMQTIRELAKVPDNLGLDLASFGNFTPLPGTRIYNELIQKNEISDDYMPSFASGRVTYSPPGVTTEELASAQRKIILTYWLNPKRLLFIFRRISVRDIPYIFRRLYQIILRPENA